jgi:hypothetical protein
MKFLSPALFINTDQAEYLVRQGDVETPSIRY